MTSSTFRCVIKGDLSHHLPIVNSIKNEYDDLILTDDVVGIDAGIFSNSDEFSKIPRRFFRIVFVDEEESDDVFQFVHDTYLHGHERNANLMITRYKGKYMVITSEKSVTFHPESEVASVIHEFILARGKCTYYRTKLKVDPKWKENYREIVDKYKKISKEAFSLNMFEEAYPDMGVHFGFLALRVEGNRFLIACRVSGKEDIADEDIILVNEVDNENRIIHVTTENMFKKASIDSNLIGTIFKEYPSINSILHTHNNYGFPNETRIALPPGTVEYCKEVLRCLKETRYNNKSKYITLKNHGSLILECPSNSIPSCPVYERFPHYYNLVYGRFQRSTSFTDLVKKETKKDWSILDMCCGTGEVALELLRSGFKDVTCADINRPMLDHARKVLEKEGFTGVEMIHTSMRGLNVEKEFDAIVIRQAVNYFIDHFALWDGFKVFRWHLKEGGKLIFNAPNPIDGSTYPDRTEIYKKDGYEVMVHERNKMLNSPLFGRKVIHTQNAKFLDPKVTKLENVFDKNVFALYLPSEFEEFLSLAGFETISIIDKDGNAIEDCDKTRSIYCIATK